MELLLLLLLALLRRRGCECDVCWTKEDPAKFRGTKDGEYPVTWLGAVVDDRTKPTAVAEVNFRIIVLLKRGYHLETVECHDKI